MSHSFLVIPECPVPLLGRDLLTKLKAQIQFTQTGPEIKWGTPTSMILALKLEDEYWLHEPPKQQEAQDISKWLKEFPKAWAETGGMGMAERITPIMV